MSQQIWGKTFTMRLKKQGKPIELNRMEIGNWRFYDEYNKNLQKDVFGYEVGD